MPATVTIAAHHTKASATLAPKADALGQYTAALTAYRSKSLPAAITVDPGLANVQIPAASDEPDAVSFNVLFTGPAPAGGLTVNLHSDNSAVTVPASCSFQAGAVGPAPSPPPSSWPAR